MADGPLPPPPINDAPGSYVWLDWYRQLRNYVTTSGSVPWYIINFAGSNITDLVTRLHNQLQGLQGGSANERYHLTAAQHAVLTPGNHNDLLNVQGGDPTNRYHLTQDEHSVAIKALPTTGGVMTGAIGFSSLASTGSIDLVPDPLTPSNEVLDIDSPDGVQLKGPFITLDSSNIIVTIPGGQVGSPLVIAGFDSLGRAILGWAQPSPVIYSVSDTHDANVIIKAAGTPVPSPWVDLGLTVILTEGCPANTATLIFDVHIQNPTTRTGVLEYGMRINGVDYYRDITQQISANFDAKVPTSVPLTNAYTTGDVITLIARVLSESNTNFALNMLASPTDLALMRFQVARAA